MAHRLGFNKSEKELVDLPNISDAIFGEGCFHKRVVDTLDPRAKSLLDLEIINIVHGLPQSFPNYRFSPEVLVRDVFKLPQRLGEVPHVLIFGCFDHCFDGRSQTNFQRDFTSVSVKIVI